MINATPILKLYANRRMQQLHRMNAAKVQSEQLLSLVAKAARTQFGLKHSFEKIRSVEEYQVRVPLRRYEQFWEEYWKPNFPRLVNCTWPGLIEHFPVSSGTSSGITKYIPCSREMLSSNTKAGVDLLSYHVTNRPNSKILGGKSFMLGGSTDLSSPSPGVYLGDLSGIAVKTLPWWARQRYFPPTELALLKNWEEKVDTLTKLSLSEDIRMVSGVPSWMLIFFDNLSKLVPQAEGKLSRIYENLEMIVHGGVSFTPYMERFKDILRGSNAELREVYPASEGFVAIADRGYGEGLRLNVDHGLFFEFVPLEELDSKRPKRHWLHNVELDVNYAVVLSTCAGLWSYVLGDTVRFIERKPPRVLITGRTSYYLSAFGEHLIAEEVEDGVNSAAAAIGATLADYTVGPVFPEKQGDLGGHIYVIEFASRIPTSDQLQQFVEALDKRLCERNEDYEAHRSGGYGLNTPLIFVVAKGCFAEWMKSRGKLGGQNKVPRIITDKKLLEGLLTFAEEYNTRTS
jgi:hypothetical protein